MNFRDSESAQKLAGSYYTPKPIADFLSKWLAEGNPTRVLEPSCGDGALLSALAKQAPLIKEIVAVDIDPAALAKIEAKRVSGDFGSVKATVIERDFLAFSFDELAKKEGFDAVIGNPPFIRYQYLDKEHQERTERVFGELGLKFTKHTNAWVPFVIQSIRLLNSGGRMAMVVPTELMHVLHANSLRDYLLKECDKVAVVHLNELFDDGVLQGVVLLLCSKKKVKSDKKAMVAFPQAAAADLLNGHAADFIRSMPFTSGEGITYKWMEGLLSADEAEVYAAAKANQSVKKLVDLAEVDVGIVTGANSFFLVNDQTIEEYDLHQFAEPMFGRSSHVRGVRIKSTDIADNQHNKLPTNFLRFPAKEKINLPKGAQRYIEFGESQSLHTRYKCRIRDYWYVVPSVWASDIAMLKRAHHTPRLLLNETSALSTDTAYRLAMQPAYQGKDARLVWNFTNSLTALSAELEGRHYGGGVIEMVPSEIERLMVPFAPGGKRELEHLDRAIRSNTTIEQILMEQDEATLAQIGISPSERKILHSAWQRLRHRRQRSSGGDA